MESLIIFILSVSGLSWIVTRGKICKSFRERVSFKRECYYMIVSGEHGFMDSVRLKIFLFLEGILNCYGCFGLWAGLICYVLQKCNLEIVLYAFAGSMASLLLIGLFNFLDKK